MKKFILVLLSLLSIFIFNNNVNALSIDKEETGYYYYRYQPDGTKFSDKAYNYYVNNKFVYCIEPGRTVGTEYSIGSESDLNLDEETLFKVRLAAFYGYGYDNHFTQEYKFATQAVIWHYILGTDYALFTTSLFGKGTVLDVSREIEQIENKIKLSGQYPSYHNQVFKTTVGGSINLVSNNTLSESTIDYPNVYITNNYLMRIVATEVGKRTITQKYEFDKYSHYNRIYVSDGQAMLQPGNVTMTSFIHLDVSPVSLTIKVIDFKTNEPVENAIFKATKDTEKGYTDFYKTNEDGIINYSLNDLNTVYFQSVSYPDKYIFVNDTLTEKAEGKNIERIIKLEPKESKNNTPKETKKEDNTNDNKDEKEDTIEQFEDNILSISQDYLVQTGDSQKSLLLTQLFLLSIVLVIKKIITLK